MNIILKTTIYIYIKYFNYFNSLNNFDFYCDDYFILRNIEALFNTKINNYDFLNDLRFLYLADSVNIFSDGTASNSFFSDYFYKLFQWLLRKNNDYSDFKQYYDTFKSGYLNNESFSFDKRKGLLFLLSLIVNINKSNNYDELEVPSKYFLATTQQVIEANNDAELLTQNKQYDDFFNPYNTISAGFIDAYNQLNSFNQKMMLDLLNVTPFDFDYFFDSIQGYNNYFLIGNLTTDYGFESEAKKIIKLYKQIIQNKQINQDRVQILYKPHPRDIDIETLRIKLIQTIKSIDK